MVNKMKKSKRIQISMMALLTFVLATQGAKARRPNILFILTDDQRNDTLGCAGRPF
jgi:hypothetical protein